MIRDTILTRDNFRSDEDWEKVQLASMKHNDSNDFFLIMSSRAFNALSDAQKNQLSKYYKSIIHTDLTTIEKYGGGSARCMLNELF